MAAGDPQVAVITGASSGIGAATALRLARAGMQVVLVARRQDLLDDLSQAITGAGGRAETLAGDLSTEAECVRIYDHVLAAHGGVDVLVNNAGIGWYGFGEEMPWTLARQMIEVNMASLTRLTMLFLAHMKARDRGHIINVGSIVGSIPSQGVALYAATKSFIDALTTALYRELRGTGIHISVVRSGAVSTPFFETAAQHNGLRIPVERLSITPEKVADRIYGLIRKPVRVAYVPRILSVVPWVELSLGWLIDLLGPLLLRYQSGRTSTPS
jgi:hypothetical protein